MNISSRIRTAIERSGLTITAAAAKCDIPYSSLQNYIRGEREPKVDALVAIGTHLSISMDWLLTGKGAMQRGEGQENAQSPALTPRETAMLALFNELDEDAQREIHAAAEEKKRLIDMEKRISRLEAGGTTGKKMA